MNGHEKSLLGKRARLENESHSQDEHVTEIDKARTVNVKFEITYTR